MRVRMVYLLPLKFLAPPECKAMDVSGWGFCLVYSSVVPFKSLVTVLLCSFSLITLVLL